MKPCGLVAVKVPVLLILLLVAGDALCFAQAPPVDFRPALPRNETTYNPPDVALPSEQAVPTQTLEPVSEPAFRIAFLADDAAGPDARWYRALKEEMLLDSALKQAMQEAGVAGIALRPCDGPQDMLQRMAREEFDLVFAPALVYVRNHIANGPNYRVLFQERRSGDRGDVRGGGLVRHRGVLFVRRGSALDQATQGALPEQIGRRIADAGLALSSSYDAAGGFYIRKMLWEDYGRAEPAEFLYLDSPADVVKAVISGLCEVGACEESVLEAVFDQLPVPYDDPEPLAEEGNRYLRFLGRTDWVQTDPVLLQHRYHPAEGRFAALGRHVARLVKYFHNADPRNLEPENAARLEQGSDRNYTQMVEDVNRTEERGW